MKKTLAFLCLAALVLLSACQAPAATPTPTAEAKVIPPTAAPPEVSPTTAPPELPPTATPTTGPEAAPSPTPSASGACTDAASFVADVTIPDYEHFDKRAAFTKTWRVKNTGTCAWTADYKAVYLRGDTLSGPQAIALVETAPGGMVDISANLAAPPTDGKFQVFYQLVNASGSPMHIDAGDSLWALITVGKYTSFGPPTPVAPQAPTPSGSGGSGGASGPGFTTITCVTGGNSAFLDALVTLVNAQRAANSLPALTLNDKLSAAAQNHSQDMACNNFLQHSGWNGSTPESRIAAAGYSASVTRENIYAQPPQYGGDAQAAVTWWMGDQIHRDAILNAQVTEIGVGYATYARSDLIGYFTVDFAAP
jgi:uncharacterized protein YkwD